MATTTSITTTYAGEFKNKYISAALFSGNTIANGGITVKPNIKYKEVVKKLALGSLSVDATCDFAAASSVTLTERILQPEEFQVNLQLCKKDFRSDWEAISMGISVYDNLPKTFQDFLVAKVAATVAKEQEISIWRGATGTTGQYDGFVTLATADPDVVDVTGTSGGVTAANVIAELGSAVDAMPSNIYGNEGTKLYIAQNVARAYIRALGGFGASGLGAAGTNAQGTQWFNNGSLSFDGVPIFVANGLADSYMIVGEKENLWYGTGLLNDATEVRVLDMEENDGSQNVRIILRYTAAVQYGIGSELVLYTPS
jgi:hypothetical protein